MIKGLRDSEGGEVDKGRKRGSMTQEERAKIKEVGDKKSRDSYGKMRA